MTSRDVADYFNIGVRAVEAWRYKKFGPKFIRISFKCVRYKRKDVIEWEKNREVNFGGRPKKNDKQDS